MIGGWLGEGAGRGACWAGGWARAREGVHVGRVVGLGEGAGRRACWAGGWARKRESAQLVGDQVREGGQEQQGGEGWCEGLSALDVFCYCANANIRTFSSGKNQHSFDKCLFWPLCTRALMRTAQQHRHLQLCL